MADELLQEIGGRILTPRDPGFNSRLPIPIPTYNGLEIQSRPSYGHSISSVNDLAPWQQRLYQMVRDRKDVLVNVNPAGGKTKPIVFAWQDSFGHDPEHDRILWITPTVQLANQVFHVDLKEALLDRIKKWTSGANTRFPTQLLPIEVQAAIARSRNASTAADVKMSSNDVNALNHWLSGTALVLKAAGTGIGNISQYTIASVCTYPYAVEFIKKQRPNIVVIDELQQYTPILPSDPSNKDKLKEAQSFVSILREIPRTATLVLLTGSMNAKTTDQIIDFINKHFSRKLTAFSPNGNEGSAANRAYIHIEPHTKMKSQSDRLEIIKHGINNKEEGSCMIMFSAKSTDPQDIYANGIFSIAKRLTLMLPQRSIKQVFGVDPTENISHDMQRIAPHPYAMNQNRDQQYMSLSAATARIKGNPEDPEYMASYLAYMLNHDKMEFGSQYATDESKESRADPFLAKCILCGFGYLANGGKRSIRMHNDDIMLVQNLFKQGKIYFLLATDMIGVGTTLTIRKLYLPELNKFSGQYIGNAHVDSSSLVQLINRVGRQTSVAAHIYCNPEDYIEINRLLRQDPKSEVDPAIFGNGSSNIEQSVSLVDKVRMVLNTIRSQF